MNSPPDAPAVDLAVLAARLDESFDVLRDTYTVATLPSGGTGGGWYHDLARPDPGSTATALGLLAFVSAGRTFELFDEGLAFLAARQADSGDGVRDGGWSTRTSLGMPVVEATAWIARFLAQARCDLREDAPDVRRAYRWLLRNQNPDGGWGSLLGSPSRVWLTCLALRALAQLNPYDPAVERGVEWLTADRTARRPAWGPTRGAAPTVTHTAFVLVTLAEARPELVGDRLPPAFDWLRDHLDPDDDHIWIETYDVAPHGPAPEPSPLAGPVVGPVWRLALWHHGLPVALMALLRDPRPGTGGLIARAFRTMTRSRVTGPRRDGSPGAGRSSLWTVWWRLEALLELSRLPLARPEDVLHWLPDAAVVQRAHARDRPLPALLPQRPRIDVRELLRRHWTVLLLVLIPLGSLIGVAVDLWDWKDFWLSVILPIALTTVHESMRHRRAPPEPAPPEPAASGTRGAR